jgi:hypothetical protein
MTRPDLAAIAARLAATSSSKSWWECAAKSVADRLGRDATLIELNPEYARMAERRIRDDAPMLVDVTREEVSPCRP